MVRFIRTASIAPGKVGEAIMFAKQIADYVDKSFGTKLEVMMPIGGNPNRIAWRAEYADLASVEDLMVRSSADTKYMDMVKSGGIYFIPGSVSDSIWKSI